MNNNLIHKICLSALFSIILFIASPTETFAQSSNKAVTIRMENTAMEKVMAEIERQTKLLFASDKNIDVNRQITVDAVERPLTEVLDQMTKGTDIVYNISGSNIILSKRAADTAPVQPAKPKTVTGVVTDPRGAPVAGAYVMIKGTSTVVLSGVNGDFSITVPSNDTVLSFSFMGMETQDVTVGARNQVSIVLQDGAEQIEEVVVTGMATLDRRMFTGATDRLAADDVMIAGLPEISRALEGRSAGVTVQNVSGTFGAAPKIRIRGATSISGDSKPLWVVDGVIMEDITEVSADDLTSGNVETLISSAISGLNSDDIESFQILKDGSATSIYGARAMAGVIVITTKRGKAGISRISYNGEFTVRQRPNYSQFNIMNSQEQMGVYQDMYNKGYLRFAGTYNGRAYGVYGKMYEMNNTYDPVSGQYALSIRDEVRNAYLRQAEYRNTDWFKELFKVNIMQTHSVSLSTGTEKSTFYGSMSLMEDPGWTDRSRVRRMTANANFTHKIVPNLMMTLIATGSYRQQEAPGTQKQGEDVVSGAISREFDINPYSYALNTSRTADANTYYRLNYAPFNIHNELENNYIDLTVADLKFQGELKWNVIPGLDVSVLGALKYSTSNNTHHVKDSSNQALAYRAMIDEQMRSSNPYLYNNPDTPYESKISVLPNGGFSKKNTFDMLSYDFRASLNWNKSFGDHYTSFYGGMEANAVDRKRDEFYAWGVQYEMGEIPFYMHEFFKQGVESGTPYYDITKSYGRSTAFFGLLTYSWKGRYTLNGTIRYEGSNQLGRSRRARWLPTWNISGRWNVHEEKFFERARDVVNTLNFRASYSLTADKVPANIRNSEVLLLSEIRFKPQSQLNSRETNLYISALENSELTYEKKHEINLGLDAGFLNDRLNFTLDLYQRNQFDLIGSVSSQGTGGFMTKQANVAAMKSKGIELSVTSVNIKKKDFSWITNFIFSNSVNEITSLLTVPNLMSMISGTGYAVQGNPVRSLYSLRFLGLTNDGIPIIMDPFSGEPTSGRIDFQGTNWNKDFMKYEGSSEPTITGSFGNTFRYKNFGLNLFITYSFGNRLRLDPSFRSSYSDMTASPREFDDRWMAPGDELATNVPAILSSRQNSRNTNLSYIYNAYNYTDIRMVDGGFIRMKEISLSYDFPKRWLEGWKCSGLALKFQATNPFLIYSDKKLQGQDPEFFRSGGVAVPIPRQFTLTLKISM